VGDGESGQVTLAGATRIALTRRELAAVRYRAGLARLLQVSDTEVLAVLHLACEGPSTPTQLSVALGLFSGGTTAVVDRLVRSHLVARTRHPRDRRSVLIDLTAQAVEQVTELMAPLLADLNGALDCLDEAQGSAVAAFVSRAGELTAHHADRLAARSAALAAAQHTVPAPGLWG
jgi:DNA-binding MarR family transcriptional regulator